MAARMRTALAGGRVRCGALIAGAAGTDAAIVHHQLNLDH